MRRPSRLLPCALVLCALVVAGQEPEGTRSAMANRRPDTTGAGGYDRKQSAALFVGVRHFQKDKDLTEVRYAVDDAIDLAFVLALDRNVALVEPGRVMLALSGEPEKPESRQHLDALVEAGATLIGAEQTDILSALDDQARAVGSNGMLIVGIATHGFHIAGAHHLLAANSMMRFPESTIATDRILDIASTSAAPRSLVFLDACRMRVLATIRGPEPDIRAAAPYLEAAAHSNGQAVFYAAAAGEFAFDDDERQNGVFTAAVLDGLRCQAATDPLGFVTIATLEEYVDQRVKSWVLRYRDGKPSKGIQLRSDGGMRSMPVAICRATIASSTESSAAFSKVTVVFSYVAVILGRVESTITGAEAPVTAERPAPPLRARPARLRTADDIVNAFGNDGMWLWRRQVGGPIVQAEVADLDGDGANEVVVGVGGTEGDGGKILVFDARGQSLWSADTTLPLNYEGGHSGRMTIRAFTTGDLFRKGKRQVVVLAIDAQGWYPSILQVYDSDGKLQSTYWHPGHLHKVLIGAPTPRSDPRIIVSGVNNDLSAALGRTGYASTVFAFDPRHVTGEAPPRRGRTGKGSQLWYGVVLPVDQTVQRLELLDHNQDGVEEISVWTSSRTVFYLDFSGQVVATQRGDGAVGNTEFGLVVEH